MPPKRINAFTYTLQSEFRPTDDKWSYNVPGLPKASDANAARLLKSLELVSNSSTSKLELRFLRVDLNRATASIPSDKLIHFSCADFRLGQYEDGQWKSGTARESADYLIRLLKDGITINNALYSFYGHSSSQLKSRSCYLIRGSRNEASNHIESLGDFSKLKTVAKKAKRIGLLFSSCHAVINVADERYEDIDDIERLGYNFTDGCGLIGPDTAKLLARKLSIVSRNIRYNPSVYQIRFKGYKGIVTLEPRMRKGCWFQFRKSMRKFSGTTDPSFAVVEYSKPYTYGYLNDDIVLLLHALGISVEVLLDKQSEHFRLLQDAITEPPAAFMVLCALDRFDLAEKLVLRGIEHVSDSIRGLVTSEYTKMVNKRQDQKCRVLVQSSRLVFGACDSLGVLEEGECFLRVTDEWYGGKARTIMGCEVLVTRNPCLHLGDVRKLRAVDRPGLCHLKDCIIFSIKGDRPAADQMSGGDLDGDTFFVCWDPALIPSIMSEPAEYPPGREPLSFDRITAEDRIEYFARYTSASLGRVKSLFLEWAIRKGPFSSECQELNRLHSLSVDGNRVKIPPRLETIPPITDELREGFVLNILHREGEKKAQERLATKASISHLDPREVVEDILSLPRTCSEFYMIRLVHDWCRRRTDAEFSEFMPYFNIDSLTVEQRHWLLQELPPTFDYPSLVMNGLLGSEILQPRELSPYHLDYAGLRWKCIFSVQDRLGNLLEAIEKSFHQFHRKLLVLQVHERFSIGIYVPNRVASAEDALVGNAVRVLVFPHTHRDISGHRRIITTGVEYRLYYDDNYLQLYDKQRGNTFIWLGRPASDSASYRSIKGAANRARERQKTIDAGINHDWAISIALQKFGQQTQTQIGRIRREGIFAAELYVISNNDVESFRTLDLLLDSVDTVETRHLFEKVPPPLTIPQLPTVDWASQRPEISRLLRDEELSLLDEAPLQANILPVLQLCFDHNEIGFPAKIYRHYLESTSTIAIWSASEPLVEGLLKGLIYTPANVIFFSRLTPWEEAFPPNLVQSLRAQVPLLVRALIQASNDIGSFTVEAMRNILREAKYLPIATFREVAEQACLVVNSPEQILDIFFEVLEPLSHVLLGESLCVRNYLARNFFGIALDHSEEARESQSRHDELWVFEPFTLLPTLPVLKSHRRLDAPQLERLVAGDHVRFKLARYPENVLLAELPTIDAIVESAQPGEITFKALTYPPAFAAEGRWYMKHCGSFVTSKAMMDSLVTLLEDKQDTCALYSLIVEDQPLPGTSFECSGYVPREDLNESQNQAVMASLTFPLTCIWGPPGTGKTHTVAVILQELLRRRSEDRVLVTAPTHNAVDNILRRYLKQAGDIGIKPLRVSTNIRKVAQNLIDYTCDGMEGKEINSRSKVKRLALERIQQSRLIFTTCAGAGLGLLRDEKFQIVIIDEASQQTEPMSLIPLSKGCTRAILVGDHVQLRVSAHKHAKVTDLEISLFERLYNSCDVVDGGLSKVMLNVQYRMHPQICNFPSQEFYDAKLTTDDSCSSNSLQPSRFPWPIVATATGKVLSRRVFVPCLAEEDIGYRSKGNIDQVKLCKEVYQLLTNAPSHDNGHEGNISPPSSIAILTPYTRQVKILKDHLPSATTISSIDAFQGQEADIIIYVTVRCNPHGDLGFLSDLRRLNVVLTRAKAGLIVIGCPRTLSNGTRTAAYTSHDGGSNILPKGLNSTRPLAVDGDSQPVWERLVRSLTKVDILLPEVG